MINININSGGGLVLSTLVTDKVCYGQWLHSKVYYGYTKKEAKQLFKQHLVENNYQIVKG